jgi:phage baseplate assembly protein W
MASFGVALPLTRDSADGFTMVKNFRRLVRQNLKMLLLTNPGERVMEPKFGVGLKKLLFENYSDQKFEVMKQTITKQTAKYLPAVTILDVNFNRDPTYQDRNMLGITVIFAVPAIGMTEMLEFTI